MVTIDTTCAPEEFGKRRNGFTRSSSVTDMLASIRSCTFKFGSHYCINEAISDACSITAFPACSKVPESDLNIFFLRSVTIDCTSLLVFRSRCISFSRLIYLCIEIVIDPRLSFYISHPLKSIFWSTMVFLITILFPVFVMNYFESLVLSAMRISSVSFAIMSIILPSLRLTYNCLMSSTHLRPLFVSI